MEVLRAWRIYVSILALALVFAWVVAESQSFQTCVKTGYSENPSNAAQKPQKEIAPALETYGGCAGGFLQTTEGEGLITAFATLLIAIFTGTLYAATKEQGRLTQVTANIAKDSLIVGNGAFVFVPDIDWSWQTKPDDLLGDIASYSFHPIWQNSGNTQTKNMVTMVASELSDSMISERFDFTATKTTVQPALIGPKSRIKGGKERDVTVEEMEAVASGKKFLYLWGWATYQDIFPDTKPHLTRYCIQVRAAGDIRSRPVRDKPGPFISFSIHARGNCSDDECTFQGLG